MQFPLIVWRPCCIAAGIILTGCALSPPTTPPSAPYATPISPATSAASPVNPNASVSPKLPLTAPVESPVKETQKRIQQYLQRLATQGFAAQGQGVWLQNDRNLLLANHQGTQLLSAASLTKVATTLAALKALGPNHRFITQYGATGPVQNGVLRGDLVVVGGSDPLFVWEEAVIVGNLLNQLGIREVTGNLVVVGNFVMNFEESPQTSAQLLRQGINAAIWPEEAETQFQTLPQSTARPQVKIAGQARFQDQPPPQFRLLVEHASLPLAELLKKMNQYSNNPMADMLALTIGGPKVVERQVVEATGLPAAEIRLINGSGLGEENQMSPRMAVAIFRALVQLLESQQMTLADVLTVVGQDEGILTDRRLPKGAIVKSGSLNRVSALAGVVPTEKQGMVWFAIFNSGENLEGFRVEQEALLNSLIQQWQLAATPPALLQPNPARQQNRSQSTVVR